MTLLVERHPLPDAAAVEDLLGRLLERRVTCASTQPPAPGDAVVCAIYRDDSGELAGMVLADVELANHAGAALALVPPARAAEATASATVSKPLFANFSEVANVASRWFNGPAWPHVVLASVHHGGQATPPGTLVFRFAPRGRRDYLVTVDGYGQGRLSVLTN